MDDLVRLGNKNDGGYLLRKSDLLASKLLLSFGIETDWSFEKEFISKVDIKLDAYDASTNFSLFIYQSLYLLYKFKPLKSLKKILSFIEFKKFFSDNKFFHKKFLGDFKDERYISLETILSKLKTNNIFIKIDIEGSEYRCLDTLIEFQEKYTSVIIEFHDVDCNLKKIIKFIKNFKLNIVHIHVNNYTPLTNNYIPKTIEVTFSSQIVEVNKSPNLPNKLDAPNNPELTDYKINFKKLFIE